MSRRVLLSVYEAPGFGGAATSTYALHAKLLRDGVDSHALFSIRRADVPFYLHHFGREYSNPARLEGVHLHFIGEVGSGRDLRDLVAAVDPDVTLSAGHVAAEPMSRVASDAPALYFMTGVPETSLLSRYRPGEVVKALRLARDTLVTPSLVSSTEQQALSTSHMVIPNSPLTAEACEALLPYWLSVQLHPAVVSSVEWTAESVLRLGVAPVDFDRRDIDLLFVATSWQRWEKNLTMVRGVAARCPDLRVHVVGHCLRPIRGVVHHGLVGDQRRVVALLARSRAVVCPSYVDAAPGILFEAAAMGCNVVASRNCGNWELCPETLVVDPYSAEAFTKAARAAVERPRPSRLDALLAGGCYRRLREILEFCD